GLLMASIVDDERLSAEEMDERRRQNIAYEYLCHLEEAKQWIEACVGEQLPPTTELENGLRNGVYLGKLARFFAPQLVSEKKIYDRDQSRYKHSGLHFRHTDNTVQWLRAMESVGFPKIFYPETTDVYDRKNMPKVIYLQIFNMRKELDKYGIQMPAFSKIGGILANELSVDEAALHAAVFAINEAIDKGHAEGTMAALQNPNALLRNTQKPLAETYQDTLSKAKRKKEDQASGRALDAEDQKALLASLRLPALGLVGIFDDNSCFYLEHFTSYREHKVKVPKPCMIVLFVFLLLLIVVLLMDTEQEAVVAINAAIRRGVPEETVEALLNPEAQLPIVYHTAASLYQGELFSLQLGCQAGLTHEELCVAVEMLSAVSVLNEVLDTKDSVAVIEQSSLVIYFIMWLFCFVRYADTLIRLRAESLAQDQEFLTWNDVQKCIDSVNVQVHEEHERVIAIAEINEALNSGDPEKTLDALLLPTAKLQGVNPANAKHYHDLLLTTKDLICKVKENNMAEAVADINRAVSEGDAKATLAALQCPDAGLRALLSECAHVYHTQLSHLQSTQAEQGNSISALMTGIWKTLTYLSQLTTEDIQSVLSSVTAEYNREQLWLANEPFIIRLQALIRGYLVRRAHNERLEYLRKQEPSVIRLQASWKGYKQRRVYKDKLKAFQDSVSSVIKLQSLVKMWKAKRSYSRRLQYFKEHVKIVKIQAYLKANKARVDYRTLTGSQHPPLGVVRKFVHLLEQSSLDLQEEQEVTRLREEVVTNIRANQQMEKDLNLMDIKIGLLVKNRITLQDVVSHSKKMKSKKNKTSKEDLALGEKQGIKGLSKEKRKKLEAYQHLFYLLQTNPSYLAKLIFQMPQNKSTKFMDTVIFTLYNYASNQREEYLLLKLFESALQEEIKSKVDHIQEIVTGNPTVIKLVLSFYRGARGQNALRQLLGPVVKEIIEDKNLGINTNPVDIYKAWVNQLETATGEASKLPYEVTPEQALSHEEVRVKMESSNQVLRTVTDKVLGSIMSSLDTIPYGMRYIAKVLKDTLHEKFPDATEDELLKIVGTLLYYRYMNPAIVAPDGFDIIDMTAGGQVHTEQRRNLASVAKMLQHAAANKLFEDESDHLTPMNSYISQTYQRFRGFFQAACDVPAPEEKFNVDEYSDMVTLSKPVIYISIEEIINTHSLVLEHKEAIAPDHSDLLHELLKDLGEVPDVESLLENSLSQVAKTEISLTLTNKFELLDGDDKDTKGVMMKTKKLIVDVVRIQPGETLTDILETPASAAQEAEHAKLVERQVVQDSQTPEGLKSSQAMLEDHQLPLEQKKRKILRNLRTLEQAGLVSSKHKYQEIINDISKDIRYQRRYRQRRKAELVKLQQTLTALNSKAAFYQEQINYYDTYIKTCLDNLNRNKKSKASSLKYTAAKLHEKGVILEIEGLQTNQLKNVMFDICPCEEVGDFEIKAKFMGVEMEKVQLHFQDLLQLQYEGVAVMKMFDKAKVNVNLLIFLLNKKFYGK
uniref:IQ motif containing GTPase activating protein 2 n=1 Tax=Cyprinus carpio carpio TaxID=630221 RepID=A0A8C1HU91_CYPCA